MSERRRVTLRTHWSVMTVYERFEQIVALVLSFLIAVVIVVSVVQLVREVATLLWKGSLDPLSPEAFQLVFGSILTVLIAMEFRHSIVPLAVRTDHIVQVKTVILVALLAITRKFIVLEGAKADSLLFFALAAVTLVLGVVYWLLSDRDR
ncbi:MAG TPA: diguanylate cyclase [Actinobacteria bacterium]|nr:diguanylate cyclase [Actinomycetota bacterium]